MWYTYIRIRLSIVLWGLEKLMQISKQNHKKIKNEIQLPLWQLLIRWIQNDELIWTYGEMWKKRRTLWTPCKQGHVGWNLRRFWTAVNASNEHWSCFWTNRRYCEENKQGFRKISKMIVFHIKYLKSKRFTPLHVREVSELSCESRNGNNVPLTEILLKYSLP